METILSEWDKSKHLHVSSFEHWFWKHLEKTKSTVVVGQICHLDRSFRPAVESWIDYQCKNKPQYFKTQWWTDGKDYELHFLIVTSAGESCEEWRSQLEHEEWLSFWTDYASLTSPVDKRFFHERLREFFTGHSEYYRSRGWSLEENREGLTNI